MVLNGEPVTAQKAGTNVLVIAMVTKNIWDAGSRGIEKQKTKNIYVSILTR